MQAVSRIVHAQRKPFTDASLKDMFAACRKLVPRLKGWRLTASTMYKNGGITWYDTKRIHIARRLLRVFSTKEIIDVVLHELAHAILPRGAGHGPKWVQLHRRLGGTGSSCCRVFRKPHAAFLCKCSQRLAYGPSQRKWCLECESLERVGRMHKYRRCNYSSHSG